VVAAAMIACEGRLWPAADCRAAALPFARERFQREFRDVVDHALTRS